MQICDKTPQLNRNERKCKRDINFGKRQRSPQVYGTRSLIIKRFCAATATAGAAKMLLIPRSQARLNITPVINC